MRFPTRLLLGFGVLLLLGPSPARAGTLDHLLCERAKDPQQVSFAVDMMAEIQPEFSARGCVVVKPFEFCVPATKHVLPPGVPPLPGVMGQPLKDDYVCYLVKCPAQQLPPPKQIIDQFGARVVQKFKPYKICVPARKTPVPCGATGPRGCAGACPNPDQTCQAPADICGCFPHEPAQCGLDPATGQCGGVCPSTAPNCVFHPGDPVPCHCEPSPCHLDSATGCGGTCPDPNAVCTQPAGAPCGCYPPPPTCHLDANGQCGGTCPSGKTCTQPAGQPCDCYPSPPPCQPDAAGGCGGTCSDPHDVCTQPPGATCGCYPPPPTCGLDSAGQCGGTCPSGQTCTQPTGQPCRCYPPCALVTPPTC